MKKVLTIIILLSLAIFAVGCGDKPVAETEQKQTEQEQEEKPKIMTVKIPADTDVKEHWKILASVAREEEKPTSVIEDDPDAKSVKDVALEYLVLTYTVDYQTFSQDTANFYLSAAQIQSEKTQKGIKDYIAQIQKNQYISELVSVKWGNMVFTNDKNRCLIFYYPETKVTSATPEYFEKNNVTKDRVYSTVGCLGMLKENGKWKIDIEDVMQIEEVAKKEAEEK